MEKAEQLRDWAETFRDEENEVFDKLNTIADKIEAGQTLTDEEITYSDFHINQSLGYS
ncbi:MAG: hypothetical protein F6K19_01530 [Cyanothece sp. SIO1E1]|nr:hypothetical protein [Cyanothece sp. SIO1E1]